MANPLPNEEEIYRKIEKKEITIDPEILGLIRHHIGNDLQVIFLGVGLLMDTPPWVLRTTGMVTRVLCRLHILKGGSLEVEKVCRETLIRAANIKKLLNKIRDVSPNGDIMLKLPEEKKKNLNS